MAKLTLTADAARRIVEAGTVKDNSAIQTLHKPNRGQRLAQAGHYLGKTKRKINGTGGSGYDNTNILDLASTAQNEIVLLEGVKCPLLRSTEEIDAGTLVIVSQNIQTGEWQIIEAQCPVEESSSSSDNNGSST